MNCKKHISIYLALFILFVNSSASLVLHYCEDQIAYMSLVYQNNKIIDTATEDSCCSSDYIEEEKEEGCCSNKKITVANKIDYSILNDFQLDFTGVHFVNETTDFFDKPVSFSSNNKITAYHCYSNAPPFYKLYSQLIFYA